eukprot:768629-Hanusia_phi.AAC.2
MQSCLGESRGVFGGKVVATRGGVGEAQGVRGGGRGWGVGGMIAAPLGYISLCTGIWTGAEQQGWGGPPTPVVASSLDSMVAPPLFAAVPCRRLPTSVPPQPCPCFSMRSHQRVFACNAHALALSYGFLWYDQR